MCVISREPGSEDESVVSRTKIYAQLSNDGKKQITVYENMFAFVNYEKAYGRKRAIMVLPVPSPWVSVLPTRSSKLFERLASLFTPMRSAFSNAYWATNSSTIVVRKTGSYLHCTLPDIDSLKRCPLGDLENGVIEFLSKRYAGFSFLACVLAPGEEYAPLAYEHEVIAPNTVFMPTTHFHDGKDVADWDHEIYCAATGNPIAALDPFTKRGDRGFIGRILPELFAGSGKVYGLHEVRQSAIEEFCKNVDISREAFDTYCETDREGQSNHGIEEAVVQYANEKIAQEDAHAALIVEAFEKEYALSFDTGNLLCIKLKRPSFLTGYNPQISNPDGYKKMVLLDMVPNADITIKA